MHTILRHLAKIGDPMLPSRGKRAGWVTLVCNGAEGYWYEVSSDLREGIATSLDALRNLANHLGHDAAQRRQVDELLEAKSEQLDAVDAARRSNKKG